MTGVPKQFSFNFYFIYQSKNKLYLAFNHVCFLPGRGYSYAIDLRREGYKMIWFENGRTLKPVLWGDNQPHEGEDTTGGIAFYSTQYKV